ncbi:DUF1501 domain-containing protein [Aquabacterium humicola]|uniref:DUF1501 domain-containing protein n=1 Tax=Aquabacterium humicola TaxID=3237377 RepID=UPI0025437CCA|nr:DUF1501 domain-containing protein [Rubrivivax pictus]
MNSLNPSRRSLMKFAGTLLSMGAIGWSPTARAALSDYRALVCLNMIGGNDGNNMVVPLDSTRYGRYVQLRSPSGLALSVAAQTLLPPRVVALKGTASPTDQPFALHYGMPELDGLFGDGKLAVVLNAGSLIQPLTKAQYTAGVAVPSQLFSHSDQILQTQAGAPTGSGTGWGGRLLDSMGAAGPLDAVSIDNTGLFVEGAVAHGNMVPSTSELAISGMNFWPQSAADARRAALVQLLSAEQGNIMAKAANQALLNGLNVSAVLRSARSSSLLSSTFPGTSLGQQLKLVAQLIHARSKEGPGRQAYYVSIGGFDTHSSQSWQHWNLLSQVSKALAAFQAAMEEASLAQQVTTFTLSEFGRTMAPNSSGTDHGWGNHQLVLGGAVVGGLYGEFPDFIMGGADDATARGTWIPRYSNQQFGATLGRWFGVDSQVLVGTVFKAGLANFAQKDIGFMGG